MLVLKRRVGQVIWIGDDIELVVLEIDAHVKLGFFAPDDVNIVREELLPRNMWRLSGGIMVPRDDEVT